MHTNADVSSTIFWNLHCHRSIQRQQLGCMVRLATVEMEHKSAGVTVADTVCSPSAELTEFVARSAAGSVLLAYAPAEHCTQRQGLINSHACRHRWLNKQQHMRAVRCLCARGPTHIYTLRAARSTVSLEIKRAYACDPKIKSEEISLTA